MQTRDHKILAVRLLSAVRRDVPHICRIAFIFGSIEPDRNPFTYLHGMPVNEKLRGHNYENILPVMKKLFETLTSSGKYGIREYYLLGKLAHYTADSFTFPHNRVFGGGLLEHCRYESRLHKRIISRIRSSRQPEPAAARVNSFEDIRRLHEEYLHDAGNCDNDCDYILRAASGVTSAVLRYENPRYDFCGRNAVPARERG